ncbi:MAG: precorrin-2 C20-methyltransferase [Ilumatobacteraceae bacterium]|nr:precorrin-2 C20-methyltransferase [Ilumatobacteraceae bacterium]
MYLPEALKEALGEAARRAGRSEADFIRSAIETAIDQSRQGTLPRRDEPPKPKGPLLIGIGMGPGAADLVAPRAIEAIRGADRVIAGSIGSDAIGRAEAIARAAAGTIRVERLTIDIVDEPAQRHRSITEAAERIVAHLDRAEIVVFLTLGDPGMFSIFPALADAVRELRPLVPVRRVPGIMAFQELAARSDVVIADEGGSVRIVAVGRDASEHAEVIADTVARGDETLVLYRGGRSVPGIVARLVAADRADGAVVGELLGMPGERIAAATEFADDPASYLACLVAPAPATGSTSAHHRTGAPA